MPEFTILYSDEQLTKLAAHGVTIEEFQQVVRHPSSVYKSRSSENTVAIGRTADGRLLACVYEEIDDDQIFVVTAYEV